MGKKFLFSIMLSGFLLVGCGEGHSVESSTKDISIANQCRALSKDNSFDLEYIVGSVLKARKMTPTGDCNPCDQYWEENPSHFSAAIEELNNKKRPKIIVITEPEPTKDFMNKDFYMEKGGVYEFCAHPHTPPSGPREDLLIYKIPDTKLINKLK